MIQPSTAALAATAGAALTFDRGTDMVLADHITPLSGGLSARTTETVRFTPPEQIDFRLVRGPVPYVVERFQLTETPTGTALVYHGELGTDLGPLGGRWAAIVAPRWEAVVADTFAAVKAEAERRERGRTDGRVG